MLIRPAKRADALDVARVHVRSWQAAYRGLMPDEYLDGLRPEERARRYDFSGTDPRAPATIVAVDGDALIGFATVAPAADPDAPDGGELCALYVDPDHLRRGVGSALLRAALAQLRAKGYTDATLWVHAGNRTAQAFYRRHGWSADGIGRSATAWGVAVDEVRYHRAITREEPVAADPRASAMSAGSDPTT